MSILEILKSKWWAVVVGALVVAAAVVWRSSRTRYPMSAAGVESPESVATLAAVRKAAASIGAGGPLPTDVAAGDISSRARDELTSTLRTVREVTAVKSAAWAGEYLRVVVAAIGNDGKPRDLGVYAVLQNGDVRLRGTFGSGETDAGIGAAAPGGAVPTAAKRPEGSR